jgi:hypothetical protein
MFSLLLRQGLADILPELASNHDLLILIGWNYKPKPLHLATINHLKDPYAILYSVAFGYNEITLKANNLLDKYF